MPQATSIALADRESTPVTHTFTPAGEDANGTWTFLNKSVEEPIGRERFAFRLIRGARSKIKLRLTMPTLGTQTVNGIDTTVVVRESIADLEFAFDNLSTLQERKNLVGMIEKALASSQTMLTTALTDVEDLY